MPRRTASRLLAAILLAAAALRLGTLWLAWTLNPEGPTRQHDTPDYITLADSLLKRGRFSPPPDAAPLPQPELRRTPGYPLYLAAFRAWTPTPLEPLVGQALLGTATVFFAYLLALRLAGPVAGLAAAAFVAIDPASIAAGAFILSESLFTFFLSASFALLPESRRSMNRWRPVLAGAVMGLAALVRPLAYPLGVGLAMAALAVPWRSDGGRRARLAGLFLAGLLPVVGAWQARNWTLTGRAIFSTIASEQLINFHGAAVMAVSEGLSLDAAQERIAQWQAPDNGEAALVADRWHRGLRIVLSHPLILAADLARGSCYLWATPAALDIFKLLGAWEEDSGILARRFDQGDAAIVLELAHRPGVLAANLLEALFLLAVCVLACVGAWRHIRLGSSSAWQLAAALALGTLLSDEPTAYGRLRSPLMPLAAALAGAGIAVVLTRRSQPNERQSDP